MPFTYKYPHPAVTVDCIIFALHEGELKMLLIQRRADPYRERWAIPGGFLEINESIDDAARRELFEETGVKCQFVEQLYTFGEPKRDPRERVITVAYYSLLNLDNQSVRAASDALKVSWFPIHKLPSLAFDHGKIVTMAIERLRNRVLESPLVFELLPVKFKLPQLQKVYETILQRTLDKRNFRKKILSTGMIVPTDEFDHSEQRRPAQLYQFDRRKYQKMQERGFTFEIKPDSRRKKPTV